MSMFGLGKSDTNALTLSPRKLVGITTEVIRRQTDLS